MHFHGTDLKYPSAHRHGSRFLRSRRLRASLLCPHHLPCTPTAQEGTEPQPRARAGALWNRDHMRGAGTGNAPRGPQSTETTESQDKSRFGGEAPCKDRFDGETDSCSMLLPKPPPARSQARCCKQKGEQSQKVSLGLIYKTQAAQPSNKS